MYLIFHHKVVGRVLILVTTYKIFLEKFRSVHFSFFFFFAKEKQKKTLKINCWHGIYICIKLKCINPNILFTTLELIILCK